jgi:hypothetical protein
MSGKNISKIEITNISSNGIWLFFKDKEYFLPYSKFPWFQKATIEKIFKVETILDKYIHWSELDIDLSIDIIENSDKYPLVYKN